jgi:hypothetical protein
MAKNGCVKFNYRALMAVEEIIGNYVFLAFWEKCKIQQIWKKWEFSRTPTSA